MNINAIGISGYATSGKTEVAKYLEQHYGFKRRHIAEPLRAMLVPLLKAYGFEDDLIWAYLEGPLKEDVIPELGVTPRYLQITLGTEWGRVLIKDSIWAEAWRLAVKPDEVAINDSVRFPNEQEAIDKLGGFTIMIERPHVGPAKFTSGWGKALYEMFGLMWGVHPSERIDLIDPDYTITNDGTMAELHAKIDSIMAVNGFVKTGSLTDRLPRPQGDIAA